MRGNGFKSFSSYVIFRFQNARLREVFDLLAKSAGINILFDKDVRDETISIFVKDASFKEALNLILSTNNLFMKKISEETGYPRSLEVLVEGVPVPEPNEKKIRKYLRRIPIDPFTRSTEWGTRCYEDEPDSLISCDRDVYDVYTRSDQVGLDGTKVQTW